MEETAKTQNDFFEMEETVCKQDVYVRKAKEQGWRCGSSFKLLEIDERFDILKDVKRAVDLYASPGIWTQVVSRRLSLGETAHKNDKWSLFYNELALHQKLEAEKKPEQKKNDGTVIVAVDSYGIPPYPGVVQIDGDLAQYSTVELIMKQFDGNKVDLVLCSKFINHTGLYYVDVNYQANHVVLVLHITCHILKPGGTLVVAIFKESDNDLLKLQLSCLFKEVDIFKPKSCRTSTKEIFAICRQYSPPEGFNPKFMLPYLDFCNKDFNALSGVNRIIIPFLVCGDISAYPLSPEEEELYIKKFTEPFPQDESRPRTHGFKKEDLDHYLEKMNEAIKSVGLESDPDVPEMDMIKKRNYEASSSTIKNGDHHTTCKDDLNEELENIYDNGPLFDLIQKTTKIKKFPCETDESEMVPMESGFQFLYEDESTDPEIIRECLEHVNVQSSTCTCEQFP